MRVCFFGAGAVGGYFGSVLARTENEVSFIARGEHLVAMKVRGLRVESINGNYTVEPMATDDPAELGEQDLVVLAVKSYHTEAALEQMSPLIGKGTAVMSLQNGVENEERIAARYGQERVVGGVAYIGSELKGPGLIKHTAIGRIAIGKWPSGLSQHVKEIATMFVKAGIKVCLEEDIRATKWRKLLWNASFNPVSVLVEKDYTRMANDLEVIKVLGAIMEEVRAVARANGVEIGPGAIEKSLGLTSNTPAGLTSMHQDFQNGKQLELDDLLGVVVRKGAEAGVATPVSMTVMNLVAAKAGLTKKGAT